MVIIVNEEELQMTVDLGNFPKWGFSFIPPLRLNTKELSEELIVLPAHFMIIDE